MKRLFTSFLGAVCLFALSACSDEETPAPQPLIRRTACTSLRSGKRRSGYVGKL